MTAKQRDFLTTLAVEHAQLRADAILAAPLPKGITEAQRAVIAAEITAPATVIGEVQRELNRTDITAQTLFENAKGNRDNARRALRALTARNAPAATADALVIPDGRYAVEYQGTLRFYRLNTGTGRWADTQFVTRMSSDDELRISRTEQAAARETIAADTDAARARYGREIGRCGRCNRTLTSEYRELGIGPECIKK